MISAEALELNPDTIATSCPFCMIMFDDALRSKGLTDQVQVLDLIEDASRGLLRQLAR